MDLNTSACLAAVVLLASAAASADELSVPPREGRQALPGSEKSRPRRVEGAMNGRAVVRFGGATCFKLPAIRTEHGPAHVFVVSQRLSEQASDAKWQRLLSCWDSVTPADNQLPCFCFVGDEQGRGSAYPPTLSESQFTNVHLGALAIACNAARPMQFFKGDMAEVLVYDRIIADEERLRSVREYLIQKWGAVRNPLDKGWTRSGPLEGKPERLNDAYPLSDQTNQSGWVRFEPMWDEFSGPQPDASLRVESLRLDAAKWWPKNPAWKGRPPMFFHPKHVAVRDDRLVLTAGPRETGDALKELPDGYTHTSGYVKSKKPLLYGYVEMRAKVPDASVTSCFWLYDHTPDAWTEIDIVEMAAGVKGLDNRLTMNVHVFHVPGYKGTHDHHWVSGGTWAAPFRFADDFHVYGCEWDREWIAWHVDGVLVRRIKNTHWRYPLYLHINLESQRTFLDHPMEDRYPARYEVDYVRAWTKEKR